MADNCSGVEAWAYRPAEPPSCWMAEAFARDNEALTRALQMSLSDDSSASGSAADNQPSLSASSSAAAAALLHQLLLPPEPAALAPELRRGARGGVASPTGKISKRKSRASKRSPTTYITADPANFRQMVQQVTGIRLGEGGLPVEPVLRPEPQRAAVSRAQFQPGCFLPTLDTSAFLLDRAGLAGPGAEPQGSLAPAAAAAAAVDVGPAFDFEPFSSFPTLESWGPM